MVDDFAELAILASAVSTGKVCGTCEAWDLDASYDEVDVFVEALALSVFWLREISDLKKSDRIRDVAAEFETRISSLYFQFYLAEGRSSEEGCSRMLRIVSSRGIEYTEVFESADKDTTSQIHAVFQMAATHMRRCMGLGSSVAEPLLLISIATALQNGMSDLFTSKLY